jgi:hypothetical protein
MNDPEISFRPMILEEFTPLLGRVFTADCEPNSVELTLVEAYPLRASLSNIRPPFMLIFHTPPEIFLVDGMYVLRCGDWGPDRIAISPTITPPDSEPGQYYQAAFN